jgi:ABC-type anion transport system duplicated permease subunit
VEIYVGLVPFYMGDELGMQFAVFVSKSDNWGLINHD